ncbi:MAG: hypothetical protein AAF682_03010 [Planctomycetota bacterium]
MIDNLRYRGALAALGAIFCLHHTGQVASAQQPFEYAGHGFHSEFLPNVAPAALELADFSGDGRHDLLALGVDGKLYGNDNFLEYGQVESLAGYKYMAVSRDGSPRIWAVDGDEDLIQVLWSDVTGDTVPAYAPTISFVGPSVFRIQERPSGSRLLVIDNNDKRAQVFKLIAGGWVLETLWDADAVQGSFHDVAVMAWIHDVEGVALVTDQGVEIFDNGGNLKEFFPGSAQDAFLHVLPAAETQWGRDLLMWHARPLPSDPPVVTIANSTHAEVIHAAGLNLQHLDNARFLAGTYPDMIVSRGDERSSYVLRHQMTETEVQPIFTLDLTNTALIQLETTSAAIAAPSAPALTAHADLDSDGDEDVVFLDDRGDALVILATAFEEEFLRPDMTPAGIYSVPSLDPATSEFRYSASCGAPAGAGTVEYEVWYQPSETVPVSWPPVKTGTVAPGATLIIDEELPSSSTDAIVHLLFRAIDANDPNKVFPVRVEIWSPDPYTNDDLHGEEENIYAWEAFEDIGGGGGTTRRPKVSPGPTGM